MEENTGVKTQFKKTSIGLDENIEGALCYVLGFITGIVFYILEKDSKFVKFHAVQSIITFLALMVINWIITTILFASFSFSMMWGLIGLISSLISIIMFIIWIVLMLKAYQGEMFKLPIVGDIAEKNSQ